MSAIADLRWDCWPDPDDLLLLRAVLHRDDGTAAAAWAAIRPRLDLDAPSMEHYRLYPLLADRLARIAPDEPALGMLRGVRRQSTIQTLLRLRQIDDVIDLLTAAGIETVLLKGPALALSAYPDMGLRPYGDADLLIPPHQHAAAVVVLEQAGWRRGPEDFRGNHAVSLVGGPIDVDVHRTLNRELVVVGEPDAAWTRLPRVPAVRPLPSGRTPTVLASEAALVHTIVHGTQWDAGPTTFRWMADAVALIGGQGLDWDRVVAHSQAFGAASVVHDGLVLVRRTTGVDIPAETTEALATVRQSRFERIRTRAFHQRPPTDGRFGGLPQTVAVHLRRTRDLPLSGVLRAAPGFACQVWEVDRPRQLPVAMLRRATGR